MVFLILAVSSFFEMLTMINIQKTEGFKNLKYVIIALVCQLISIYLLAISTLELPLNIAYATWTGLGTIFSVFYGMFFLNEEKSRKKLFFMFLIIVGLIGLKVFS